MASGPPAGSTRETMVRKILVVCAGNVCRSPMAEGFFRDTFRRVLAGSGQQVEVRSCGLQALVGRQPAQSAISVMSERGMDISAHRGRLITAELAAWADLILVMEAHQADELLSRFPAAGGKVFRLGHFEERDIGDPVGRPKQAFVKALDAIERSAAFWIDDLLQSSAGDTRTKYEQAI